MPTKKRKKSITTKAGDRGMTRLFSGEKVSKNSPRPEAYGDIDELMSILGLARYHAKKTGLKDDLLYIQRELSTVAAELATTSGKKIKLHKRLDKRMLQNLEKRCAELEARTKLPNGCTVSGESLVSSHIDHARTVARRCERKAVGLLHNKIISNELILAWLNRLSDYLYLMARFEEGKPTMV